MLIAGLGNPGVKYAHNRHNVGYLFVDAFSPLLTWKEDKMRRVWIAHDENYTLLKSMTYMNESGMAINSFCTYAKNDPSQLVIVHDDLDLPVGQWKLSRGKGPQLHGGINSIEQHLKTKDFWRLRIGVDARAPDARIPGIDYVLQDFLPSEWEIIQEQLPMMREAIMRI